MVPPSLHPHMWNTSPSSQWEHLLHSRVSWAFQVSGLEETHWVSSCVPCVLSGGGRGLAQDPWPFYPYWVSTAGSPQIPEAPLYFSFS